MITILLALSVAVSCGERAARQKSMQRPFFSQSP
jgi:hypothetical protein